MEDVKDMLEIQLNSTERNSKTINPCFDISVLHNDIKGTNKLFRGVYLPNANCAKSLEHNVVMKQLLNSNYNHTRVAILDCCKLYTKESDIQKKSREAINKYIGKEDKQEEYSVDKEFVLMKIVQETLEKLDDRKINNFLPFEINTVAVIAQDNSELDGILHRKYNYLSSWHAPNKAKFNFYVL